MASETPSTQRATERLVEVSVPLPVPEPFTYTVPRDLELGVGHVVIVPFGGRKTAGYVTAIPDAAPEGVELRPVERLLDPTPAFDEGQLSFFRWIAEYYLAPLGRVIATALPVAYRAKSRVVFVPTDRGIEALAQESVDGEESQVLREVVSRPGKTRRGLHRTLYEELDSKRVDKALDALVRHGHLRTEVQEVKEPGARIKTVELAEGYDDQVNLGGARMRGVVRRLVEADGIADLDELVRLEGQGARDAVRRLVVRGIVRLGEREDRHAVDEAGLAEGAKKAPPTLNAAQQAAFDAIREAEAETCLLFGVTGSGKTEVYLRAAAECLERDRQVLVLVPEISLTPLLTGRFRARFGDEVAVLHSGLTAVERLREWRRIRAGQARVAVGARSALFAPFRRLGLVIVDEEHDDSYKQDDGVRYHARDLAVVLGKMNKCPVVLGSATPSMESWQNGQDGRYKVLSLPYRATPRPVPEIELVDMRGRGTDKALAAELVEALKETLAKGAKAIVLFNRRGYAPTVECPGCGAHYSCPSCGIELVYHQRRRRLDCHYCGFHRRFQSDCPACSTPFEVRGHGTERVEEELRAEFPDVGIARMDADTTASRGSHGRILERFRKGEVQLLVGTQLVAKGHDFPDVLVAAVVGVDHILMLPDFRSAERTHALVTQLAGRAGRGTTTGRVIVQTRHAEHFVFRQLGEASQNLELESFYDEESASRRVLAYPPFTRLVLLRIEGADRNATVDVASDLARSLRKSIGQNRGRIEVLGPTPAPLTRLVGRWRYQVVLRGRHVPAFRQWLGQVAPLFQRSPGSGVRLHVDVDPRNLM